MNSVNEKNGIKIIVLVLVMASLIVGYYFYLSNRTVTVKEKPQSLKVVEELLMRDLEKNYPPSPKEVVKYYADITKCFYDGDYTDEQLINLAIKSRELFDTELLQNQSEDDFLKDLKLDIADFEDGNIHISSYSTSSSVDVEYKKKNNRELAYLYCIFNIREGSHLTSSNHEFVLRKDGHGHWKILGWDLAPESRSR